MQPIIMTRPGTEEIHIKCLPTLLHSWRIYTLHQTLCVKTWDRSAWQMELDEWGEASCSALVSPLRSGSICGKSQRRWQQLTRSRRENPPPFPPLPSPPCPFALSLLGFHCEGVNFSCPQKDFCYNLLLLPNSGADTGWVSSFPRQETAVLTNSCIFCHILWES